MIATILVAASFCSPFSAGHIDRSGAEHHARRFTLCASQIAFKLPPRTSVTNEGAGRGNVELSIDRVTVRGRRIKADWHDDYVRFGRVYFDGDTATNTSYTRWAIAYGTLN